MMLDALLEIVFEFLAEFLFQILIEIGFESLAEIFRRHRSLSLIASLITITLVGALVGLFWSNMFPRRILPKPAVTGISLFLAPICAGLVMKAFGDWRRRGGHEPTRLATFWGGFLFAFSVALVRWLRVA
jgi:hypothetical protein